MPARQARNIRGTARTPGLHAGRGSFRHVAPLFRFRTEAVRAGSLDPLPARPGQPGAPGAGVLPAGTGGPGADHRPHRVQQHLRLPGPSVLGAALVGGAAGAPGIGLLHPLRGERPHPEPDPPELGRPGPGRHAVESHGGSLRHAHAQGLRPFLDARPGGGGAHLRPLPARRRAGGAGARRRLAEPGGHRLPGRRRARLDQRGHGPAPRRRGLGALDPHPGLGRARARWTWRSPWACARTTRFPWARSSAAGCGPGSGASTARPPCSFRRRRMQPGSARTGRTRSCSRRPSRRSTATPGTAGWPGRPGGTCAWSRARPGGSRPSR